MSLTSKVFLDKRYTKSDGTQAIKIRLTIDRKPIEIPVGYAIEPKYWNDQKMEVKPSCKTVQNVTRLNNLIRKMRLEAEDKVLRLLDSGEIKSMTVKEVRMRLLNKASEVSVLEFSNEIIQELREAGKHGNARVYLTMRNSVSTFLKGKDVPLRAITYRWLKKYEAWYLGKGNSLNGLSLHLRTLRALINRAIKENRLPKDAYPFDKYTIKSEKTRKRAITEEELQRIKNFIPKTKRQKRAKAYFLMSFYLMGASFIDLAYLRKRNINNGRIEYRRKKTGALHSIKITAPLRTILDEYLPDFGDKNDGFILGVIKSDDPRTQYRNVEDELKRYNRSIREIGELCGIKVPLSSYVARHTYATIAKFKNVPIGVISEALGHQNARTTEIYLGEFGLDTLDAYNEQIVQ